jgi:hypothetical protein
VDAAGSLRGGLKRGSPARGARPLADVAES